jgi:hypothetical protein
MSVQRIVVHRGAVVTHFFAQRPIWDLVDITFDLGTSDTSSNHEKRCMLELQALTCECATPPPMYRICWTDIGVPSVALSVLKRKYTTHNGYYIAFV